MIGRRGLLSSVLAAPLAAVSARLGSGGMAHRFASVSHIRAAWGGEEVTFGRMSGGRALATQLAHPETMFGFDPELDRIADELAAELREQTATADVEWLPWGRPVGTAFLDAGEL